MRPDLTRAFTLLELLAVLAIVAALATMGLGAGARTMAKANQADSVARLRTLGHAIHLSAGEHDQLLPGPLWPGQVMQFDVARDGRLVRDLAEYLNIESKNPPYLVERMIPRAYRQAMRGTKMEDARIYIMNTGVVMNAQTNQPFGSLTSSPILAPMKLGALTALPAEENWMACEADQLHPYVATAPWKANTPARPVHDGRRALVRFDGSVNLEKTIP
ncbi:MAG: prepilin-type N-terminal cleavage/methylation domain-containing protein [Verrucomicrobiota bacterium]